MIRIILFCALLSLQSGAQRQQPPEDPHEGHPASCVNRGPHPCECNRATECPGKEEMPEDAKCQTYCRKSACLCCRECPTTLTAHEK